MGTCDVEGTGSNKVSFASRLQHLDLPTDSGLPIRERLAHMSTPQAKSWIPSDTIMMQQNLLVWFAAVMLIPALASHVQENVISLPGWNFGCPI